MEKLNLAIIGQGRSGRDIHGAYLKKAENEYFTVKYVVDADEARRNRAAEEYPGCRTFADYRELFASMTSTLWSTPPSRIFTTRSPRIFCSTALMCFARSPSAAPAQRPTR